MSNELIDELNEYADHCASSGQFQASDLISRAVAALQPSLPQDMEPEILSELLDSAMVSTGEIVPDKPSHPQDVEEWIEHIDKSGIWWDGHRHVRLVDVRAFLAGKVLVPVIELNDVLEMAGLALSMTPLDSRERKSFRAVAAAIK